MSVHMPAVAGYKSIFVGRELLAKQGYAILSYPLRKGIVIDWDGLEEIWKCIVQDGNSFCQHPVFLTEATNVPPKQRQKMAEIMFEQFNIPALYIGDRSVMSLLATAHTSGIVLHCGGDVTQSMAVYDGNALLNTAINVNVTGNDIDRFFAKKMEAQGFKFKTLTERSIMQDLKEKLCYVAKDFSAELSTKNQHSSTPTVYELPDGNKISFTNEHFVGAEAFFWPPLLHKQSYSIQDAIENSVRFCPQAIQGQITSVIAVSGGSSLFPGFDHRLKSELCYRNAAWKNVNIVPRDDRQLTSWIGASVLASLPSFPEMCTTRQQYQENGDSIINLKSV